MPTIVEAVIAKLVQLLIGWLWRHHEDKMQSAAFGRYQAKLRDARAKADQMSIEADQALAHGADVAADVANAGSLQAGSEALNAEIDGKG